MGTLGKGGLMKLILYPRDINSSTEEFDLDPQLQGGVYERFKQLALLLRSHDEGTATAAAASIQQLANAHDCTVQFTVNPKIRRYDKVLIESRQKTTMLWDYLENYR
jgi:hypothetical protein